MPCFLSPSVARFVMVSMLTCGTAIVPLAYSFAADPLVLSNAGTASRSGSENRLYWDVQQADGIVALLGDKPVVQCTATKHVAPRLQLKLTGGNFAVTQVEVMSERLNLPRVKTVPVTLSFNRGGGDVRASAAVLSSSRLVIAMPDPKSAYDQFGQATALRIAVELGDDVRTVLYDLTGLRTALSDLETCVATPATTPVPDGLKHAMPPPVPVRTPAALLDAEQDKTDQDVKSQAPGQDTSGMDHRPDVTVGVQGIPALAWPELDPPTLRIRSARSAPSAPSDSPSGAVSGVKSPATLSGVPVPFPAVSASSGSVPVAPVAAPVVAPVVAGPVLVDNVYSPARARAQQQRFEQSVGSAGVAPTVVQPSQVTEGQMLPVTSTAARNQLVISGPAVDQASSVPTAASIVWRKGETRYDERTVETYRARAGEHLRDVLRRWADRGGIDLVWNMPGDVVLDKDYSYVGAFKDALKGLIEAYPQSGINTRFMDEGVPFERQPFVEETRAPSAPVAALPGPALDDFTPLAVRSRAVPPPVNDLGAVPTPPPASASVPAPVAAPAPVPSVPLAQPSALPSPVPAPVIPRRAVAAPVYDEQPRVLPSLAAPRDVAAPPLPASPPPPIGPVKRWRALSGASMRQVIQAWAEEANVNVIWMSPRDYAVRYSVNGSTDFGRAVADLMAQYARDPVRPVGQLFNDPNGDRTLVVR